MAGEDRYMTTPKDVIDRARQAGTLQAKYDQAQTFLYNQESKVLETVVALIKPYLSAISDKNHLVRVVSDAEAVLSLTEDGKWTVLCDGFQAETDPVAGWRLEEILAGLHRAFSGVITGNLGKRTVEIQAEIKKLEAVLVLLSC